MMLKAIVLMICLMISGNGRADGDVMEPVNRSLKYIESLYHELEQKVENSYTKLKQKISGIVLSVVDSVDSRVSQAITKIQHLREECRIPAELSLENLSKKVKNDFKDCTSTKVKDRFDDFYNESLNLGQKLKDSSNASLSAMMSCIDSEYKALKELRFDNIGSCEFSTGFWVSENFIEDTSSVQKYVVGVLKFSYDSTGMISTCFKKELMESSIEAIMSAADKCQAGIRS